MEGLVANPSDMILCVSITKKMKSNERGLLYETARKYWPVSADKIPSITHVAAVDNGRVVAVYHKPQWKPADNPEWIGRWEFTSDVPDGEPNSSYLGKYVRMSFPAKYIFCIFMQGCNIVADTCV